MTNTKASAAYSYRGGNWSGRVDAGTILAFASEDTTTVLGFSQISMGRIEQALSNIAFLRAQNGGPCPG